MTNPRVIFDRIAPALADGRWQDAKIAAEDFRAAGRIEREGGTTAAEILAILPAGWDRIVTDADAVMLPSMTDGPCEAHCQRDDRRSACCRYAIQTRYVDAVAIEAAEDDRRIFQALCTERDRLARLIADDRPGFRQHLRPAHTRTVALVERWAEALRARYSAELGCACLLLPSGAVWPCQDHKREIGNRAATAGWSQRGTVPPAGVFGPVGQRRPTNEREG